MLSVFDFSKVPHPTKPGEFIEPDLEYVTAVAVRYVCTSFATCKIPGMVADDVT